MGDDARIVSAEKSRSGGVAGFFSKEFYSVIAESPAATAPAPPMGPAPKITAPKINAPAAPVDRDLVAEQLLSLADRVSEAERAAEPISSAPPAPTPAPVAAAPASPAGPESFQSVFARAERMAPVIDLTEPPAPTVPAASHPQGVDNDIVVAHTATGKRLGRLRPAFSDVPRLDRQDIVLANDLTETDELELPVLTAPAVAAPVDPVPAVTTPLPTLSPRAAAPAGPVAKVVQTQVESRPIMSLDEIDDILVSREGLVRLGVPMAMIDRADLAAEELPELLGSLTVAGAPATAEPGVIAFVGDLEQARFTALAYVEDVMVASATPPSNVSPWLVVKDAASAASRRARWMERDAASVLAVDGAPSIADPFWTMDVVEALAPRQVRVVLDASWPLDQVRPWIDGLAALVGEGQLVIELVGLDAAEQPAAAMAFGLPIATVDGEPATAARWADLLVARMLDDSPMRTRPAQPESASEMTKSDGAPVTSAASASTSRAKKGSTSPSKLRPKTDASSRPATSGLRRLPAPAADTSSDRVGAM